MTTTTIPALTPETIAKLRRDLATLRTQHEHFAATLRAYQSDLTDDAENSVATTDEIIPARVGDVPGGPIMCQRKRLDHSTPRKLIDWGKPVPVYSWVKSDSSDPADEDDGILYIFIEQDAGGVWWFTGQDCPPTGT